MFKIGHKANTYLLIIILIYSLTLLGSAAISAWDSTDAVAIFMTYLISFVISVTISVLLVKKLDNLEQVTDAEITILNSIVESKSGALIVVDKDLNLIRQVYIDSKIDSSQLKIGQNVIAFMNQYGISQRNINSIIDYTKNYQKLNLQAEINQNAGFTITNLKPFQSKYIINLGAIHLEGKVLFFIKIIELQDKLISKAYDLLPVGYFEFDEYGSIILTNDKFEMLLGYSCKAADQLKIGNIIIFEDEEIGNHIRNGDLSFCNGYFQGVMSLKSKYGEVSQFFVNLTYLRDGDSQIRQGFVIKLKSSNYILDINRIHNDWLEYCWKSFFEKSPYSVLILDEQLKIVKSNNAFADIIDGADPTNKRLSNYLEPNYIDGFLSTVEKVRLHPDTPEVVTSAKFKNLHKFFTIMITRILDFEGNGIGYIIRIADITQQRQLEENFSHAQRMQTIGHLVGSVAHDFNNILTAISGFCDLLLLRHGIGDPSFSNIIQIKQSSDRASKLVRRLLAFSRKQTLQLQTLNPIDLFTDLSPLISRLIGSRIHFVQKIDPNIWNITVDPVQMEQVILNLVVNAHHAMGNEGDLTLHVDNFTFAERKQLSGYTAPEGDKRPKFGDYVMISVKDSGCGISKENLKKIFEPFFTTKNESTGTGFGLSTVHGIINQSNAYVFVKSAEGKGTEFVLLFERALGEPTIQKVSLQEKEPSSSDLSGKGTILLVEDEDAIRIFAKKILTQKGYSVIDFCSAKEAYDEMQNRVEEIDLVVTDVLMPEMSGPTFVTKMQKIKPDIKVIFISGYAEEAFTAEYGENRSFNFIAKPFSLKQLLSKIKSIL